jgi:hypothetical protein
VGGALVPPRVQIFFMAHLFAVHSASRRTGR